MRCSLVLRPAIPPSEEERCAKTTVVVTELEDGLDNIGLSTSGAIHPQHTMQARERKGSPTFWRGTP